ncbi:MAG: hypothetical protein ACTSRG_01725 [Candidatus Helarchaeota archaeon]
MKVLIDAQAIEECKQRIQEHYNGKDFKEIGGYMLGIYDGETFNVKNFHLDKNAESTAIRIKLSVEAFHEIEQILENSPGWLYIGTWHVHPGSEKPHYSHVDTSTLFLERIILETDNPENLKCPKIHIIFNSSLSEHSCYTMDLKFNYTFEPLNFEFVDSIIDAELLDVGVDILRVAKELIKGRRLENFIKLQKSIEEAYNNLDSISEQVNTVIDILNEYNWYQDNANRLEKIIKKAIKNNEKLGIISYENKKKIESLKYRPKYIKNSFDEGTLIGFWIYLPYENIDELFLKIFLANFYKKIETEPGDIYLFFLAQKIKNKIEIEPYFARFASLEGLNYIEIETELVEDDI